MAKQRAKETSVSGFLSKDGERYSTYEQMRRANIRFNERRLKAKGLDNLPSMSSVIPRPRQSKLKSPRKATPIVSEPRRSSRIRNEPPTHDPMDDDAYHKIELGKKHRNYSPKKRRPNVSPDSLSDAEREVLRQRVSWLNDMDEYLDSVQQLSAANRRSVMRQVEKLVSGQGITYHHWKEGVFFAAGRAITLGENFQELYQNACTFEDVHGKDLGNGWLLRHPIKKMEDYQVFVSTQERS